MAHPIILIDGMSLVFRAYYAMQRQGMRSPAGEPTGAVFAFVNILTSLLEKHDPEAIAVVFDTAQPTFRHEMYPEYKAHRDAFPEDLGPQLKHIKDMITLLGLESIELPGFEADDIIGTIASRESAKGHEVLCITSDKDYFQLVNDKVRILRPGNTATEYEPYDAQRVKEKFGVGPERVIDVLALMGDSSDNVPGVKGVGEKTALPLIQQHGSLEHLYEHLDSIEKASLKQKLIDSRDMAFLSKKLVTIHTDVPINHDRAALHRQPIKFDELDSFFEAMGFHQIRRKYAQKRTGAGGDATSTATSDSAASSSGTDSASDTAPNVHGGMRTLKDVEHDYVLVQTQEAFDAMLADLGTPAVLCVDLETTSLDAMSCDIVGVALSVREGHAWYVAVDDRDPAGSSALFEPHDKPLLPVGMVLAALKPLLEDPAVGKIGQNLKYDMLVLRRRDIRVHPVHFDTMLASYVLDPDRQHGMDALAVRWMQYEPIPITTLIGEKKATQISMRDVDPARVAEYAGEDADVTLKLYGILRPELEKEQLDTLTRTIEFPLEEVLVEMEHTGIAIDVSALGDLGTFMRDEAKRLSQLIYAEAGVEFNIASGKQLGEVLFETLKLPTSKKTKTGFSADASVLSELAEEYPIAQLILDYRQVEKLRSTYVESLPRMINPRTGRVHTTYNQTIASTGRLSSTDPNLQNIPVRTELGQRIRKAFVPQHKDALILSCDYSQIELRIMASIAKDEALTNAFVSGADIHAATAAVMNDVAIDQVTTEQRRAAKAINFGIMYGLGAFGLSQRLGISRTEGQAIIDNYFLKYPGIKAYMDSTIEQTRERGYAATLMGRRRYFPMITSNNRNLRTQAERAAINMPIQGTAADMMKLAMLRVHAEMRERGLRSLMMLQVHDELVFEAFPDEIDALQELVVRNMVEALPLRDVPVVVESGRGSTWFDAH
jgi:DNA polymerase-1